jgi:hypothetical protein
MFDLIIDVLRIALAILTVVGVPGVALFARQRRREETNGR